MGPAPEDKVSAVAGLADFRTDKARPRLNPDSRYSHTPSRGEPAPAGPRAPLRVGVHAPGSGSEAFLHQG